MYVYRALIEWEFMFNLEDVDGTLTGLVPEGPRRARVLAASDLYPSDVCVESELFSTGGPHNGVICNIGRPT